MLASLKGELPKGVENYVLISDDCMEITDLVDGMRVYAVERETMVWAQSRKDKSGMEFG